MLLTLETCSTKALETCITKLNKVRQGAMMDSANPSLLSTLTCTRRLRTGRSETICQPHGSRNRCRLRTQQPSMSERTCRRWGPYEDTDICGTGGLWAPVGSRRVCAARRSGTLGRDTVGFARPGIMVGGGPVQGQWRVFQCRRSEVPCEGA
jgi:hypothetical protein